MITKFIAQRYGVPMRDEISAIEAEIRHPIDEQFMPTRLPFKQHRKRRIPTDIDLVDRVHLAGNSQGHSSNAPS